jgi:hypothetical protein
VDSLQLGTKTSAKIKEVLATGRVARVAALQMGERGRCVALFLQVWGVGDSTAEHWYDQGARRPGWEVHCGGQVLSAAAARSWRGPSMQPDITCCSLWGAPTDDVMMAVGLCLRQLRCTPAVGLV